MKYISVNEKAEEWNLSKRAVRDYCNKGRVIGAVLEGKTWKIPEDASKPKRETRHVLKKESLLEILRREKTAGLRGGIYHRLQIEMTYNSNHMEGSSLSHDETRCIFETRTIGKENGTLNVDDIIETSNHFRCVDLAIDSAERKLSESLIKEFHRILKSGTADSLQSWFRIGDYKLLANEVGGKDTASPEEVHAEMKKLLQEYDSLEKVTLDDIIEFHYRFERIHPFQDGNGRVGRLIMLKECLRHDIVPVLIQDECKAYYYRGLKEYENEKTYLRETCLFGQDIVKGYLDKLGIK